MRAALAQIERHGPSAAFATDANVSQADSAPECPIEEIAQAYLHNSQGDPDLALRCAITDALSDLLEAERRARENSRLISKGYIRNGRERG